MLRHRYVVGSGRYHIVRGSFCLTVITGHTASIHRFTVLVVRKTDGAVIAPVPASVGSYSLHSAVPAGNLQLSQQLSFGSILAFQTPRTAGTPVPAVSKLHGQLVLTVLQQFRHIVGLVLNPFAVIRVAGSHAEITDLFPAQPRFIQAAGGDIQPRLFYVGNKKSFPKAIHGIAPLMIHPVIPGDPFCLPVSGIQQAQLKGGNFRPRTRLILFVPKTHLPGHQASAFQFLSVIGSAHSISGSFPAVP